MTMEDQRNEIIVYQPDKTIRLDVRLEGRTVWLTQAQMTDLFQRDRTVITRHINNVFAEGELDEESNVHFLHIATSDKPIKLYSLNVVISVGYRVKSARGTQFRIWATDVILNYLLRGYAVNDRIERLEQRVAKHDEQIGYFIKSALPPMEGVLYEGQICDGHEVALKLIRSARKSIKLIDNWVDGTVFTMLSERRRGVLATVYSRRFSESTRLALEKHNAQYAPIQYVQYAGSHDRFLIVDETIVYHIGASLKDISSKLFAFSRLSVAAGELLAKLPV